MVVLRRSDPSRNMARYYELSIQTNLFGKVMLVRRWGRAGTYGRRMEVWFDEADAAVRELERFMATKLRRGYRAISVG